MTKTEAEYLERIGRAVYDKRSASYRNTMSVREAGQQIGIAGSTVSRLERGKPTDIETFRKVCIWLGMSADELLGI